jgi:S1-C subfamily serine protease
MNERKRKVVREWIGVSAQSVTPDIAKILGLKKFQGTPVPDVVLKNCHS